MEDEKFLEFLLIRRPHVFQQKIRKSILLSTALQGPRNKSWSEILVSVCNICHMLNVTFVFQLHLNTFVAFSKLKIIVSSFISSINSSTSLSFHAIPRDFPGDSCRVSGFPLSVMLRTVNRGSICTCSSKSVLTKGAKAHQRKVGSARLIVYTAHFSRAGLDFLDRVPILSVLGLPRE